MVEIKYVDGDSETIELSSDVEYAVDYDDEAECFLVYGINSTVIIPRDFVKSIRHIKD